MKKIHSPLLGIILFNAIYAFDFMVIAIAMPTITEDLNGQSLYTIGFGIFTIASLIGVVWAGKTIDRKGPHFTISIGFSLFIIGLIIAGLSPNFFSFIVSRGLQGLGGGIAITSVNAVTNLAYSKLERPRIIAIVNTSWLIPSLLAPGIGGFFISSIGWRYIFWLQLPCTLFTAYKFLPLLRHYIPDKLKQSPLSFWIVIQLALGATLLLFTLNEVGSSWKGGFAPIGLILLYFPLKKLLPSGTFLMHSGLPASLVCFSLVTFIFYISEMFIPLLFARQYHLTPAFAGFVLTIAAITWPIGGVLQARMIKRLSYRFCACLGATGITIVLILMLMQTLQNWPYELIYIFWGIGGFWLGQIKALVRALSMEYTKQGQEGKTASSLGILDSLTGGFAAGIGGMIYNLGSNMNISLLNIVGLIWFIATLAGIFLLYIFWTRGGLNYASQITEAFPENYALITYIV